MLIIGPSFRRNASRNLLPALERYDGISYRIARKHLRDVEDVSVVVMIDDLTLVNSDEPILYSEPEGGSWRHKTISKDAVEKAKAINEGFLHKKLKNGKYREVFISMGKEYAKALPTLNQYGVKVVFPTHGGPGPKAQALKKWIGSA
jgi:hypothetical protein